MLQNDLDLIRSLEEELLQAAVRASPDRVSMLLADDFVEFGRSGGVYNKKEVVSSLAAEGSDDPYMLSAYDFTLTPLAEGVVLLTYRSVRESVEDGTASHALRSSVWKIIGGHWRMVFHQGTPTEP